MRLFDPRDRKDTDHLARVYAAFEIVHTAVDFLAAGLFIVGSFLFFSESTKTAGIWCFVAGSICFALKPTIRLTRELRMASMRNVEVLARKAPEAPPHRERS
ncbi:YrhK family protein [Citricoccus sp. GCM10030269]|uniref:YrhK family protein n=1 Tax=Citricoccus sp. GCM10030269 TaxID=3273388 RepID=UPI003612397F